MLSQQLHVMEVLRLKSGPLDEERPAGVEGVMFQGEVSEPSTRLVSSKHQSIPNSERTVAARKTRQYVSAAVESLTLAIELFNRPSPAGREHATVMMADHAFEMLLKGAIYEKRRTVAFSSGDRSFDLGKCVAIAESDLGILTADDRVLLMALKEDRDTATHDVISMSDDVLWIHLRSAVTIFRRVLNDLTGRI